MHNSTRNHPPPEAAVFVQPQDLAVVVSISPFEEDHSFLRQVFDFSHWQIHGVRTGKEGVDLARRKRATVVVCEEHLPDFTWKQVLCSLSQFPDAPALIVTSRLADDALWAEVLNLGGYDLLMKPLDRMEALRVMQLAWKHAVAGRAQRRATLQRATA